MTLKKTHILLSNIQRDMLDFYRFVVIFVEIGAKSRVI